MGKKATKTDKPRPAEPDRMGRMGESRFAELCEAGSLIAPDSRRVDKMGWDFHVEFPHPHERGETPFDVRSKLPDMKVQVKTIWSDRSVVDVELPAAERLAGWDYPSFIVILRMNEDLNFEDAYVIHLLGDNLAIILKALRVAEAAGSLSIKNKTVRFGARRGVKIAVNGAELARAFRSAIGVTPDNYVLDKRAQRKSLGFTERPFSTTFTLSARDEAEVLDIFLGLKPGAVDRVDAVNVRFGVAIPLVTNENAIIEIKPESRGECEVVILRQMPIEGVQYSLAIFIGRTPTFIPAMHGKCGSHRPSSSCFAADSTRRPY